MRKKSFTLIEIIASTAILSVIGTLLVIFARNGYNAYSRGQAIIAVNDESNALTSRIANGLRGTFQVDSASNSSVTALSYFAPADATPTKVTITKTGTSVSISTIIGVIQSDGTYIYNQGNAKTRTITSRFVNLPTLPLFQFYDESNTLLTSPITLTAVHLIEINSTIFSILDTTQTATASTKVELRNLKTNL